MLSRAPRWQALSLASICAAALLSLHACDRLFPEQPVAAAVTAREPAAQPDHGDTPAAATSIRQGSPLAGEFGTESDIDYFKVEVTTENLLYVSTDQGNPHHAPTVVSVEGTQGAWSSNAQDQLVNDLIPGTYYIKVERDTAAAPLGDGYDLAVWLFGRENETFDIQLREGAPDLPVIAIVVFDTGDIGRLEANGSLLDLAIHEMAHALGFGMDLWRDRGYLQNPTIRVPGGDPADPPPDTHFTGPRARQEFGAAGGTSYVGAKVPLENDTDEYGEGSLDAHWREAVFQDELMTATVGLNALVSRVTLGSLEDLGYAVNYDAADPYRLAGRSALSSVRAASGVAPSYSATAVADDIYREPPRALELSDELVEVLGRR